MESEAAGQKWFSVIVSSRVVVVSKLQLVHGIGILCLWYFREAKEVKKTKNRDKDQMDFTLEEKL